MRDRLRYLIVLTTLVCMPTPVAASDSLSNATPSQLEIILAETEAATAPPDALRRAEALYRLGNLRGNTVLIHDGIDTAQVVRGAHDKAIASEIWTDATRHVATALVMVGRLTAKIDLLDEAIGLFAEAAEVAEQTASPDWPVILNGQGIAYWSKGTLDNDPEPMQLAANVFAKALAEGNFDGQDAVRLRIKVNAASVLLERALLVDETGAMDSAITAFETAKSEAVALNLFGQKATIDVNHAQALALRDWKTKRISDVQDAISLYKEAIDYWDSIGADSARIEVEAGLRQAHRMLAQLYDTAP
ncbi:MAG: hypothetical protein O2910_04935 [Proteobacteria bacterium]|nr:hypothetical protein [Pseudomonadota bacterium]